MNLKKLCLLALMAAGSMVFATVDLRTTIRDVYVQGTCEETGIITFSVNGDDFQNASTAQPVYIRIRLDHAAVLCKSLVYSHASNVGNFNFDPIFLPINFEEKLAGDTISALPETLSIVRWRAGEPEFWMKVQTPSSTWISNAAGGLEPPNNNRRVRWTIGLTARTSWEQNKPLFDISEANLPSATRDVSDLTEAAAVSTLICVDLSGSNLEPLPAPSDLSELRIDPTSWNFGDVSGIPDPVATPASFTGIAQAVQVPTAYSGDRTIARGYDFNCGGGLPDKFNPFVTAPLCLNPGVGQFGVDDTIVCISNSIHVEVFCGTGWGFHRFSRVHLETEAGTSYGFLVDPDGADPFPGTAPGVYLPLMYSALNLSIDNIPPYGSASSAFTLGSSGVQATRNAETQYSGVGFTGGTDFFINATVCQFYQDDPTDVNLEVCILASNRDSVIDDPPFDGINGLGRDQEKFCDPSLRKAFEFVWEFGAFLPCQSSDCARIFFPYLPKMIDSDFYTGLSFVNQGLMDLTSVTGDIYESDGSHYTVDFGGLAVRNQRTFLIADLNQDGNVVFDDAESDTIIVPNNEDGDLTGFGDVRSSMFIVGCIFLDDLGANGADLDGYLLIGNGDFTSGSYTARNFEISRFDRNPNQDGDLPVQFDKKEATFAPVDVNNVAPNATIR